MTVKELIEALSACPENLRVCMPDNLEILSVYRTDSAVYVSDEEESD